MKHVKIGSRRVYGESPFSAFRVFDSAGDVVSCLPVKGFDNFISSSDEMLPLLPEGKFRVIRTKSKKYKFVVDGEDTTNRCLFFVGYSDEPKTEIEVLSDTGGIIFGKTSFMVDDKFPHVEALVILDIGQWLAFGISSPSPKIKTKIVVYFWDGSAVSKREFSPDEWETYKELMDPSIIEKAEVL